MGHRIAKHVLTSANVLEKSTYYILDAQGNTIATYERAIEAGTGTVTFAQKEKFIYGSARLGVLNDDIALYGSQNATYSQATWTHIIGKRNYELSNHLGNVLSVISDKPMPVDDAADGDVPGGYKTKYGLLCLWCAVEWAKSLQDRSKEKPFWYEWNGSG
jgi:hypothetical protein